MPRPNPTAAHLRQEAKPTTRSQVAADLNLADRPTDLLVVACASLGLLERAGEGYRNSALAEHFLVPGRRDFFGGFITFCDRREYLASHRLTEAVRSNKPVTWDPSKQDSPFENADPADVTLFSMRCSHCRLSPRVPSPRRTTSARTAACSTWVAARRAPHRAVWALPALTGTVYDLAQMCRVAARNIAAAGLQESIGTVAGDFLVDDRLPPGYDVVLLSMILHDWDEATGRALLRKCFAALPPGGTLLVCELIVNAEGTGPADAALMGINMLLETAGGKNYTETEYRAWLKESGFTDIRVEPLAAAGANGVRQTATLRDRPNVLRGSL